MLILVTILAATYGVLAVLATIGFGMLMRRTKSNVAAVWQAEEWIKSRTTRPALLAQPGERELAGAGRNSK
jgi:hypothetical protein